MPSHHVEQLQALFLSLCVFWAVVHLLYRIVSRAVRPRSILPTTSGAPRHVGDFFKQSLTQVSLWKLHLRIQTTAFNSLHDGIISSFNQARGSVTRGALVALYDFGAVSGVVGLLGSMLLLLWTAMKSASSLRYFSSAVSLNSISALKRRDSLSSQSTRFGEPSRLPIQLIIPGLTVPLVHLPLMLFALVVSQVVHEAGHTVTAALESVPVTSIGATLTVLFPSAFVTLSAHTSGALPPAARLRVSSSGAFHNILLWLLTAVVSASLSPLFLSIGYIDIGPWGRVVTDIVEDSPLRDHLPIGAIVTRLDDVQLTRANASVDIWSSYLSGSYKLLHEGSETNPGWCVERAWFADQADSCCRSFPNDGSHGQPVSCFVSYEPAALERCVDPVPFLDESTSSSNAKRCLSSIDCGGNFLCVWPRSDQELLRLTLQSPPSLRQPEPQREHVVVWSGSRLDILEEVEVSKWMPRIRYLPLRLPRVASIFVE
ncbi:hypothetical protein BKA93DRAFT_734418 [Sparassis latifolia]